MSDPPQTQPAPDEGTRQNPTIMEAFSSVFSARIVSSGIAFAGAVLIGRALGPVHYGQFCILIALITIVMGLGGSAIDTSLVRFVSRRIQENDSAYLSYFRVVFWVKLWVAMGVVLVGFAAAGPLFKLLFRGDAAVSLHPQFVSLAFLGAAFLTLWGFSQAYYQAHQRFGIYAGCELIYAVVRFTLVIIIVLSGLAGVFHFLTAYVAAAALLAVGTLLWLPKGFLSAERAGAVIYRKLFHFAKWVFAAAAFTSVVQRVDLLLLGSFGVAAESVGHYGAAVSLALLGDLVVMTLFNVLLPKASRIRTGKAMRTFLKKFLLPAAAAGLALSPLILVSGIIARVAFGDAYAETGTLFAILLLGTLFSLLCSPASTAVYAMGRPRIIAMLEGTKLAVILCVGLWAVPHYGAVGIAWTVAATKGTIGIITYVIALREAERW